MYRILSAMIAHGFSKTVKIDCLARELCALMTINSALFRAANKTPLNLSLAMSMIEA